MSNFSVETRKVLINMERFYAKNRVSARVPETTVETWSMHDYSVFFRTFTRFHEQTHRLNGAVILQDDGFDNDGPTFWALACQHNLEALHCERPAEYRNVIYRLLTLGDVHISKLILQATQEEGNVGSIISILEAAELSVREIVLWRSGFSYPLTDPDLQVLLPHLSTKFDTVAFESFDFFGIDLEEFFSSRLTMKSFSLKFPQCKFYAEQEAQLARLLESAGDKFRTLQPPLNLKAKLVDAIENSQISNLIFNDQVFCPAFFRMTNLIELDLTNCPAEMIDLISIEMSQSIRVLCVPIRSNQLLHKLLKSLEICNNRTITQIFLSDEPYTAETDWVFWQQEMLKVLADSDVIEEIHFHKNWLWVRNYPELCRFKFEVNEANVLKRRVHSNMEQWPVVYQSDKKNLRAAVGLRIESEMNMYQAFGKMARYLSATADGRPCSTHGLRLVSKNYALDPIWSPKEEMLKPSCLHLNNFLSDCRLVRGCQLAALAFCRDVFTKQEEDNKPVQPSLRRRRLTESTEVAVDEAQKLTIASLPIEMLKKIVAYNESSYVW